MSGLRAMIVTSSQLGSRVFIPMKNGPGGGFSVEAKGIIRNKARRWPSYQTGTFLSEGSEIYLENGDTLIVTYQWLSPEQEARVCTDRTIVLGMLRKMVQ